MAASREHLTWPLTVGADGYLVTADQDSDQEISSCMAVIVNWPIGTRQTDLEFGIEDQTGRQGGADLEEIRGALATYEPRAGTEITQNDAELAGFLSDVTVGWDTAGGATS